MLKYDILPKFKKINMEFKLNTDILDISEKIVLFMFEKMIYPNWISLKLPKTAKIQD